MRATDFTSRDHELLYRNPDNLAVEIDGRPGKMVGHSIIIQLPPDHRISFNRIDRFQWEISLYHVRTNQRYFTRIVSGLNDLPYWVREIEGMAINMGLYRKRHSGGVRSASRKVA